MNEIVKEEKLMDLNRRFNREKIKKFQILKDRRSVPWKIPTIWHIGKHLAQARHL